MGDDLCFGNRPTDVLLVIDSASLQDALLENSEFFSALTTFIEPLNGALPSLTIQKAILNQLGRVSSLDRLTWALSSTSTFLQFDVIDKDMLKQSGLGKIVNFYTRTKRVQPEINRQANLLIDKWSKPILRAAGISSGSTTGRMAATGHAEEYGSGGGGRSVITLSAKQVREKEDLLQIAVDAQRHKEDEKKGGRRPNVIVS